MKYILIVLVFVACKSNSNKKNIQYSKEILDTITIAPANVSAHPVLFETAFVKGTKAKVKKTEVDLYGITIGNLKVKSGRIAACDPMLIGEYGLPFSQKFPSGDFPVQLAISGVQGDELVAFARIKFSDEPVVRWEFALLEGVKPIPLEGEEFEGYIVDAGMGSFMDAELQKILKTAEGDNFHDSVYAAVDKHLHNGWKYAMMNTADRNIAIFSAGLGDGRYATYIGFDAKGQPCRLLTDFGIFEWRKK